MAAGHAESLLSFQCFLRDKLTANEPFSPLHVALDSTTIYWPSSCLVVPIIDTPGTGDANIINEATTQAAVDEACMNSSQLLVCGTKSLSAEASLAPFVIQYMKFMIRSSHQDTPCIRGLLLPETSGQRYTHRTVCSKADKQARQEKISASREQLGSWMHQANEELPACHQAPADRLATLLQRCTVRVAYMNLYASLCLQSQDELRELATEASISNDMAVEVSDLLEATGGPWLLGEESSTSLILRPQTASLDSHCLLFLVTAQLLVTAYYYFPLRRCLLLHCTTLIKSAFTRLSLKSHTFCLLVANSMQNKQQDA